MVATWRLLKATMASAIALSTIALANAQTSSPTPSPLEPNRAIADRAAPNEQTTPPDAAEARPAFLSRWYTPAQLVPVLLVLAILVFLWRRRTHRMSPPRRP